VPVRLVLAQLVGGEQVPVADGAHVSGEDPRSRRSTVMGKALMLPVDRASRRLLPGCPARRDGSAPQGRSPVRARPGAAERSEAALIQYSSTRQRGRWDSTGRASQSVLSEVEFGSRAAGAASNRDRKIAPAAMASGRIDR
jgi:hypothetical protein